VVLHLRGPWLRLRDHDGSDGPSVRLLRARCLVYGAPELVLRAPWARVLDHDFSQLDLEARHHQQGGGRPNQKYLEQQFGVDDARPSQLPRRAPGLEDCVDRRQGLLVLRAL